MKHLSLSVAIIVALDALVSRAATGQTPAAPPAPSSYTDIYASQMAHGDTPTHARAYAMHVTVEALKASGHSEAFAYAYTRAMADGRADLALRQGEAADVALSEARQLEAQDAVLRPTGAVKPRPDRDFGDASNSLFEREYLRERLAGKSPDYAAGMGRAGQGWLGGGGAQMTAFASAYAAGRSAGLDDITAMATASAKVETAALNYRGGSAAYGAIYAPVFARAFRKALAEGSPTTDAIELAKFTAEVVAAGRSETFAAFYAEGRLKGRLGSSNDYAQFYADARMDGDTDEQASAYAEAKENRQPNIMTAHQKERAEQSAEFAQKQAAENARAQNAAAQKSAREAAALDAYIRNQLRSRASICVDGDSRNPCDIDRVLATYNANPIRYDRDYADRRVAAIGRVSKISTSYIDLHVGRFEATCFAPGGHWGNSIADVSVGQMLTVRGSIYRSPNSIFEAKTHLLIDDCSPMAAGR